MLKSAGATLIELRSELENLHARTKIIDAAITALEAAVSSQGATQGEFLTENEHSIINATPRVVSTKSREVLKAICLSAPSRRWTPNELIRSFIEHENIIGEIEITRASWQVRRDLTAMSNPKKNPFFKKEKDNQSKGAQSYYIVIRAREVG